MRSAELDSESTQALTIYESSTFFKLGQAADYSDGAPGAIVRRQDLIAKVVECSSEAHEKHRGTPE